MHRLLHRHPCRKEFKKMEMLFDATGTINRGRTQGGACACLAKKGNQMKGSRQVLQEVPGRDQHVFSGPWCQWERI